MRVFILFLFLQASVALADSAPSFWMGALMGNEKTDSSTYKMTGAHVGFMFTPKISVGGVYMQSKALTATVGSINVSSKHSYYGAETNYYLDNNQMFFIGSKFGFSKTTGNIAIGGVSVTLNSSQTFIGPSAGINLFLVKFFSVGADLSYLYFFGTSSNDFALGIFGSATIWF